MVENTLIKKTHKTLTLLMGILASLEQLLTAKMTFTGATIEFF